LGRIAPRLPLVGNISLDCFPVCPLADGGHVEAVAPELTSPEFFLERRKLLEEFTRSDGFEDAYNVGTAVLWWE